MTQTTSDIIVKRLLEWGVDTIFGITGDAINGLVEAMRKMRDQLRFVHMRHEEVGALAAVGYAKLTGRLGVCYATAGPGAVHLLNGVLDAKMDQTPLLVITGMTYSDLIGTGNLQGADTDYLFQPYVIFNERVMSPEHAESMVDLACRTALSRRGPVHLTIPIDIQMASADTLKPSAENVLHHSSAVYRNPVSLPVKSDLEAAAKLFAGKRKIAILAGAGARGAGQELEAVAEKLGAPIAKAMLGKDCLPDESAYTVGGIGHIGTVPTHRVMEQCDALLIVGSTMPFLEFYPKPGQAVGIQIDEKPERIGLRYPVEYGLVGDAKATLQGLLPLLAYNEDRSFLEEARAGMENWWKLMERQATRTSLPMKPQVPAWALNDALTDDAIVCGDAGTVTYWINRYIKLRAEQKFSFSGTNCTMASGLSYAIGAQVAYPDRQVVAFTGDGSMTMHMGDFITCAQEGLSIKVIVIVNNTLGMEKWEQLSYMAHPEYGNNLVRPDFVKFAEACGGTGIRIEDPLRCREQLAEALRLPGPVLIEAVVDPDEPALEAPMLPAHAEKLFQGLAKGTPNRERIASVLLDNLRLAQSIVPEAINEATARLMKQLETKAYEKEDGRQA